MRRAQLIVAMGLACGSWVGESFPLHAEEAPSTLSLEDAELEQPWLEPIPTPMDIELETLIHEVQDGLNAIHTQMVRRKESLKQATDPSAKAKLYEELESLRNERDGLQRVLYQLVEEARISEQTVIDEALGRARWLERQQERWQQREELLRDRQP